MQPERGAGRRSHPRTIAPGWLTLLAFLVALVLWVIAISGRDFTVSLDLPVAQPRLGPGLMLLESTPRHSDSVTVQFTGRGAAVLLDQYLRRPSMISWSNVSAGADGPYPVRIVHVFSEEDLSFSGSEFTTLAATSFSPPSVEITVDRSVRRTVPVHVPSGSSIPERFMWTFVDRDSVVLQGAETVLDTISFISTIPVTPAEAPVRVPLSTQGGIRSVSPSELEAALVPPVPLVSLPALR